MMAPGKFSQEPDWEKPKSRPAYRPINQYDYPVDDRRARGSFFSRHRGGILVIVCTLALVGVLGGFGYLLLKSPLMGQLKAKLPESLPTAPTQAPTAPPQTIPVETLPVETLPVQTLPVQTLPGETQPALPLPNQAEPVIQTEAAPAVQPRSTEFPELLGKAQTKQNSNENRILNLQLICQRLNGTVLQSGETLSFNDIVGQRTAENGFLPAPGYNNANTPDLMGGGTNQGASTLYYCALLADLEIVERKEDKYLSAYLDPGMEAAVDWPGPDVKIRNNTPFPIQLLAEADRETITMEFRGSVSRDYYVKMEYQMTTLYADTVYQEQSPGGPYANGDVIDPGCNGAYVRSFRCKYDKSTDALLSQELEVHSAYPMTSKVIASVPATEPPPTEAAPTEPAPTEAAPTEPPEETQPS